MFTKDRFTLAWFIAPSSQDWSNLRLSGVKRLLLGYSLAKDTQLLQRLAGLGIHIVIRLEPDLAEGMTQLTATLFTMSRVIHIDAVIFGNEPDAGIDWTYISKNWQGAGAFTFKWRMNLLRDAVQNAGLYAVSPALSCPPDAISEDGQLRPGKQTWLEILRPELDVANGNAAHIYALGWGSVNDVNEFRYKWLLKEAGEQLHRPLWIDEVGVILDGNNVAQMSAYCRMADILMKHPTGARVEMFCPFVSTGDPQGGKAWDARYLLKDPAAYQALGAWMAA